MLLRDSALTLIARREGFQSGGVWQLADGRTCFVPDRRLFDFNPDQPRDEHGRFAGGGYVALSSGSVVDIARHVTEAKEFVASRGARAALATVVRNEQLRHQALEGLSLGIQALLNHVTGLDASTWVLNEELVGHTVQHFGTIATITALQARDVMSRAVGALARLRGRFRGDAEDAERDEVLEILRAVLRSLSRLQLDSDWDESKHPRGPGGKFAPGSSKDEPALSLDDLQKVGPQMGTNPGGVYQPHGAEKGADAYYVKTTKSAEHARQEKIAAELAAHAGVRTLSYRDVAGPQNAHLVATRMETLEKDNLSKLTPKERDEAKMDLAAHAWLANWDAVGLTGDNVGVIGGRVHALDFGGSLDYRAQGGAKGAAFGTKVGELDTLRNPSKNTMAAGLYGSASKEQIVASIARVTSVDPQTVRDVVAKHGGSKELADKLVARQQDLKERGSKLIMSSEPQVPPSTTTAPTPPPPLSAAEKTAQGPDPLKGMTNQSLKETHPEHHAALTAPTKGGSAERVYWRKLLTTAPNKEARDALRAKILGSFTKQHASAVAKGKSEKASELEGKLAKYATKYGMPQYKVVAKTEAEANLGFSKETIAGAKEVMAGHEPGSGSSAAPKSYAPDEVKSFNDLVAIGGVHNAKTWLKAATSKASMEPKLTAPELAHIYAYTTHAFGPVNDALRKGSVQPAQLGHINSLNAALDKLPNHVGTLNRAASLSKEAAARYKVGETVKEMQFTSSTTRNLSSTTRHIFVIESKTGKSIVHISAYPHEKEVLFKSETMFHVDKIEGTRIHMTEVVGGEGKHADAAPIGDSAADEWRPDPSTPDHEWPVGMKPDGTLRVVDPETGLEPGEAEDDE